MPVSATITCLNISKYFLYKPFHSIGMPKLTSGYGTDFAFFCGGNKRKLGLVLYLEKS